MESVKVEEEKRDKQVHVYLPHSMAERLKQRGNVSGYIRKLIEMEESSVSFIEFELDQQRKTNRDLEIKLFEGKQEEEKLKEKLCRAKKKDKERPILYPDCVKLLTEDIPHPTQENIRAQANRLGVSVDRLKNWLWIDGYYEKIFRVE